MFQIRRTSTLCVATAACCCVALSSVTMPLHAEDPKKSIDDKLFEKLNPSAKPESEPSGPDELDRTVQSMRRVGEQLGKKEVNDETVKLQRGIIDTIDALIEKLKQPPPPKDQSSESQSSDEQQDQSQSQSERQQKQQKQQSQQKPSDGASSSKPQQQQQQTSKSNESTEKERQRKVEERAAELARRRALINEVWGHLPPNVREKLLNVSSEKMLPQYEELIRKYYEALAEPTDAPLRKTRPVSDRVK